MIHNLRLSSGETIHYLLERRQRRTIGLKITDDGLVVHAPKRIAQSYIENVLLLKMAWILNKLNARADRKIDEVRWQHGETLLLLGNPIHLRIEANARTKKIHLSQGILQLATPHISDADFIARKVLQWYKQQAIQDFARRLAIFAAKLGVSTPPLLLSNAQSRWGSCNSRQEIRLNWRLLQAPPHIINYVVCHELAHLKEMNHSTKFWAVVGQLFPDFKDAEKELKRLSPQLHRMKS